MTDENPLVADTEAQVAAPVTTEAVADKVVEQEKIGDVLGERHDVSQGAKVVPEAAFLGEKKARKAAERALEDMRASMDRGDSPADTRIDVEALSEKYNVDKDLLKDMAAAIRKEADQDIDQKVDAKLRPLLEKDKASKIDTLFTEHFGKAMADMPELEKVVNPKAIKSLSLMPENANKTFAQLIQETYGNAIGGKRTFETTTPRADRNEKVDTARATKDGKYFEEVMSNPDSKKEYNAGLIDRIANSL